MHESEGRIHELEQRIRQLEDELQSSRREFESFTYAVSHDLRAPLRSILGYCQILQEDLASSFSDQHKHFLTRAQDSAQKLSRLIDALLELSRVGRIELQIRALDLTAIVQNAAREQQARFPEVRAHISIQPGMRATGDARLMASVFQHLLANAFKFCARASSPTITVAQEDRDCRSITSVRDNGVGFDMKYAERLFVPFQRLHTENEFAGLGTGLALVQRMLARQNGRAWAQAEPDRGATFFVDLPAAQDVPC